MVKRRRSLPPVSPRIDREIKPLISAMTEILEVGEGVRGDPLDRKITFRDLIDSGIGRIRRGQNASNPGALEPGDAPPDMRVPPVPTGFAVSGGFNGLISLTWDIPGELYSNHAYTRIYRSEEDNFANAELAGQESGAFYTDVVRADTEPKTYYYWITFVSTSDIEGPTNDTAGTPGQALEDTGYLIEQLTGEITRSELAQELNTEIDQIQVGLDGVESELRGPESVDGTVAARIAAERDARIASLSQERNERIDSISMEAQAREDAIIAEAQAREEAIYQEASARESADQFLALQANVIAAANDSSQAVIYSLSQVQVSDSEIFASQIDQISGQVGTNSAAITEEKTIRANETSALATQVGILSARLDARPSLASSFEPGTDFTDWIAETGNTITAETSDVYAGTQAAEIRSTSSTEAPESGGIRRSVPEETASEFQGHTIRVSFYAKQAATSPSSEAAVSYTLDSGVSSGWLTFVPGANYEFHSFEYEVPAGGTSIANEVAIWGDTSGAGGGILIDRVLVTFAETEIPEVTAAIENVQQTITDLDESLSQEINTFTSQYDQSLSDINQEVTALSTEQTAQAGQISTLTALTGENAADIVSEREARSSADDAMAQDITALYAGVGDNAAEIQEEARVRATDDELLALTQRVIAAHRETASATFYSMSQVNVSDREATATQIDGVLVEVEDAKGQIEDERLVRAQEDDALAQQINTVLAATDANAGLIQDEQIARANADGALAQQINTVQTTVGENTTSIQQQAQSIDGVEAQYTVKIDANGAVAGFGLASTPTDDTADGNFSEFYINADRFAILPQGANKSEAVAPFIVEGGEVFIDTARIKEGSIQKGQIGAIDFGQIVDENDQPVTTVAGKLKGDLIEADNLKVAEAATFTGISKSTNFVSGRSGWRLTPAGGFEANNATFRGHVEMNTGYIAESVQIGGLGALAYQDSVPTAGTYDSNGSVTSIARPQGGMYRGPSSAAGALRIMLPVLWTNTMMSFTVKVFDYATNAAFTARISGYNYEPSATWVNPTAVIEGGYGTNHTVRFGFQNSRACVWIGGGHTWRYVAVEVTDVVVSHSNFSGEVWNKNWAVAVVSSFGTVQHTITDTNKSAVWTRPGSTMINGNKIYTGDAYVDTLQIKNNAVTFPGAASADFPRGEGLGYPWKSISNTWFDPDSPVAIKAIVVATATMRGVDFDYSTSTRPVNFRLLVGGTVVHTSSMLVAENRMSSWVRNFTVNSVPGTGATISLQTSVSGGGVELLHGSFVILGTKR